MLSAVNQTGTWVNLAAATFEEAAALKKSGLFYCPECGRKMIIKAGSKITAHFAHMTSSNCTIQQRGEGEYHERGKKQLYLWFLKQGLKVELEKYLPIIQQRPDLYITFGKYQIAVEFQCARISEAQLLNRNKGYYSQGIQPIWILGGNRMKRKGPSSLYLGVFECSFLHQYSSDFPLTLYFYCPDSNLFSIFQHIQTTGKKESYGTYLLRKLDNLSFKQLFHSQEQRVGSLIQFWQKQMYLLRTAPPFPIRSILENQWRQSLYRKGLHPIHLPSVANLPVSGQYRLKSPSWVWQSQICLEIVNKCPAGQVISRDFCFPLLQQHFLKSDAHPLINKHVDPIQQYLSLLAELGYLKALAGKRYLVNKRVNMYKNVEKAVEGDQLLIDHLSRNSVFLSTSSNH